MKLYSKVSGGGTGPADQAAARPITSSKSQD